MSETFDYSYVIDGIIYNSQNKTKEDLMLELLAKIEKNTRKV